MAGVRWAGRLSFFRDFHVSFLFISFLYVILTSSRFRNLTSLSLSLVCVCVCVKRKEMFQKWRRKRTCHWRLEGGSPYCLSLSLSLSLSVSLSLSLGRCFLFLAAEIKNVSNSSVVRGMFHFGLSSPKWSSSSAFSSSSSFFFFIFIIIIILCVCVCVSNALFFSFIFCSVRPLSTGVVPATSRDGGSSGFFFFFCYFHEIHRLFFVLFYSLPLISFPVFLRSDRGGRPQNKKKNSKISFHSWRPEKWTLEIDHVSALQCSSLLFFSSFSSISGYAVSVLSSFFFCLSVFFWEQLKSIGTCHENQSRKVVHQDGGKTR